MSQEQLNVNNLLNQIAQAEIKLAKMKKTALMYDANITGIDKLSIRLISKMSTVLSRFIQS